MYINLLYKCTVFGFFFNRLHRHIYKRGSFCSGVKKDVTIVFSALDSIDTSALQSHDHVSNSKNVPSLKGIYKWIQSLKKSSGMLSDICFE